MSDIRPFAPSDVEAVASLYEVVARSGRPTPATGLAPWLRRVVLDQPWADPEIPSLVATGADGEVVGFLASHVRRLCLQGRPVRLGCSGHLVVAEHARTRGTGARLLATYLRGPQDLSITDGATATVSALWERLGGERAPLQQMTWLRPVVPWRHPLATTAQVWSRLRGRPRRRPGPAAATPVTRTLDGLQVEPLTAQRLLRALPAVTARLRLCPDYDATFLSWLFAELPYAGLGALRAGLVSDADGAPLGYYLFYVRPGGVAQVLALAAPTEPTTGAVLRAVLTDAAACGAAAVVGRVEPRLLEPVTRARSLLLHRPGALVHARDPSLLQVATSRHALLTRLEGEWALRPQAL